MTATGRNYQGETAENRMQNRRQHLLDIGFSLMATDEWRQMSLNQLCREAQLSKRYFYENFSDLAALEDAVVDQLTSSFILVGLQTAQAALAAGDNTGTLTRNVMAAAIRWLVEDPRRSKVLFSGISGNPRAQAHRKFVIRQLAQEVSTFGTAYHEARERGITDHPGEPIALTGSALLIGGSFEAVQGWLDGEVVATEEEFISSLAAFWLAVGDSAVAQTKARIGEMSSGEESGAAPA